MARFPDWFRRLDAILEILGGGGQTVWLGRTEIQAIFECSERDSIRLLHQFGAQRRENLLCLPVSALIPQLMAIRNGGRYSVYAGRRRGVATRLGTARAEAEARQFRVKPRSPDAVPELDSLPDSIRWRRSGPEAEARFEIVYRDGADLLRRIAEFLAAAGANREEFLSATEPHS
jgi:hypothetical protein